MEITLYGTKRFKEGIEFLGITDREIMKSILLSNEENKIYLQNKAFIQKIREDFQNRFEIPRGQTKKFYNQLLKETQKNIDRCKQHIRDYPDPNGFGCMMMDENWHVSVDTCDFKDYIEKKAKIKKLIKFFGKNTNDELNIAKARQYPMTNLLQFEPSSFTRCIFHEERSPSLKYYKERNKVHCFSGCGDFDTIDVYQKLNNVEFNVAVKALS